MSESTPRARASEAILAAGAGAAIAALVGSRVGLGRAAAVVGGLNGAVSGWRGIYRWRSVGGVTGFVLDSSWALTTTAGALGSHAIAALRGRPGYVDPLSRRQGRHVYERGFRTRPGFMITVGNVVSGVGDTTEPRRRRLVEVHEDVHVWQARWLGPAYPVLYAGWMAVGGVTGAVLWATRRRDQPVAKVIETCAYYLNPFEWWAYSRDAAWPPASKVPDLGWRRPMVSARPGIAATPR